MRDIRPHHLRALAPGPWDEGNRRPGRHRPRTRNPIRRSPFPASSPAERSGCFRVIRAIAVPTGSRAADRTRASLHPAATSAS